MSVSDRLPTMTDADLQTLKANAERLQTSGVPAQQRAAVELLPLIEAELAGRPAKAARTVRAVKPVSAVKAAKPAKKTKAAAQAAE
ncbi:hypothetical protein [Caulobacter sp. 17J80-11]|uniref:hypothetical protein n=1 Tax=Caulobacter sp. 17J80-11 TaxID=2763502 RepID=UPI0016537181|nr:hypothetical protein [Caulobacter sp. 17J80-11]MBC6983568.1 hypothetical protein [Caulobacter sp. 17J80-11]